VIYHHLHAGGELDTAQNMILELIPSGSRVLDLGCSSGYLSAAIRDRRGCRVFGVELDPAAARLARRRGFEVVNGSMTGARTRKKVEAWGRFDVVVAADVLEHLADPAASLRWIRESVLTPAGLLAVSIPNVVHFNNRRQVLLGRFDYTDHGLLDRTHLRFFTAASLRETLARSGYQVQTFERVADVFPGDRFVVRSPRLRWIKGRFNGLLRRGFPDLFTWQFVVGAVPA